MHGRRRSRRLVLCVGVLAAHAAGAAAQSLSQRGFVEGVVFVYPEESTIDSTQVVGDLLAREEVFVKPAAWVQFAAGVDLRANSHDQVDERWSLDFFDRRERRSRVSIHRLSATFTHGPLTIDAGKQFVRWGRTELVSPTDRFAPRDFLNVIDPELLAVTAVRASVQAAGQTFDAVWVPRFTPSREPLADQRWAVPVPEPLAGAISAAPSTLPTGSQAGGRWSGIARRVEYALSFYDGFHQFSDVRVDAGPALSPLAVSRIHPPLRTYGADIVVPTPAFTVKAEAAYFTSPSQTTDEYVLYVLQLERQRGEWVFQGGYAGESVARRGSALSFDPDRGMSDAFVARVSHGLGSTRSFRVEGAARRNGHGAFGRIEYSLARGTHWRTRISAVAIGGDPDDFFGQYGDNSHIKATVRYSF